MQAVELLGEGDNHIIGKLPAVKGRGLLTMFVGDGANDIGALQVCRALPLRRTAQALLTMD